MNVAIGSDHRALELKKGIVDFLTGLGHQVKDYGSYTTEAVDYPDIAAPVALDVVAGKFDYGILICGTGIGMCIAANKVKGVRAAMCRILLDAQRARSHNNANIICFGSEITDIRTAGTLLKEFMATTFEGGRHARRLEKIARLENR
jgi:ribose 5-phosphate isomerase B